MYKPYLIVTLFIITLLSCDRREVLYYDIPARYGSYITELEAIPHPELILKDISTLEDLDEKPPIIRISDSIEAKTGRNKLIYREYFTPVINYKNPLDSVKEEELVKYRISPLKDVKLPNKALAIDGLYPTDSNYPLKKEIYLISEGTHSPYLNDFLEIFLSQQDKRIEPIPQITWIGAVGDMMLNRGVDIMFRKEGISSVFTTTLPILQSFDFLIGNLEGAVTDRGIKADKTFTFRFKDDVLKYLKEAGFNYLSVCNNHIYDYGEQGVKDTIDNLKKYKIPTSGVGRTIQEASKYHEHGDIRVLSVAAFPKEKNGFDGKKEAMVSDNRAGILFNSDKTNTAIKAMCSTETFDIIYVHGGREWSPNPTKEQKLLYRKYIDLGADLVLGSHPHVLQGLESYKSGFIAYSLGNFIFSLMKGWYTGEESMILSLGVMGNQIIYNRIYPVVIDNKIISLDQSGYIKERFYSTLMSY